MRKLSPSSPRTLLRTLRQPDALRGIDRLIERVSRIWDETQKRRVKSSAKILAKSA